MLLIRKDLDRLKTMVAFLVLLSPVLFFLVLLRSIPLAAIDSTAEGEKIFQNQCSSCHTIGGGKKVGPDLKGVTNRRSEKWLFDFISSPSKMFAKKNPVADSLLNSYSHVQMPDLGLSHSQIANVLAYIESQEGVPGKPGASASGTTTEAGSANIGERIFSGRTALKNGGPPCMDCHNATSKAILGGGSLGPDLTHVYQKYGRQGLKSVLANIPFPTMAPIFKNHPLTQAEQLDLGAFFRIEQNKTIENSTLKIGLITAGGFLVSLLFIWIIWRHRPVSIRRNVVEKERRKGGNVS